MISCVMHPRYQSAYASVCDVELAKKSDLIKSALALHRLPSYALQELATCVHVIVQSSAPDTVDLVVGVATSKCSRRSSA